ncbi:RNA cytidine acetyltransferase [Mycena venus]|uniref:RNA cytidine acetyltransferase n=1 Tax=Mycena venus TaxID=2733690 RepID=A0A8H7CRR1_9AGAR|nr:RNA cytidine acetyltransferase [Mycena venus]
MSSVPVPPPLTPRPTARTEESTVDVRSTEDADAIERQMSEQQLRELYESEEIDRFLSLFSAYVTEVQLQDDNVRAQMNAVNPDGASTSSLPQTDNSNSTSVEAPVISRPSSPPSLLAAGSISEEIALRYLIPILPTSSPPVPMFTLGRLRLTTQRLYLAIQPAYGPFFASLKKLATWKDKRKSLFYCVLFWILWYKNLLLPSLFLRILYALAKRRLYPYPTLAQLRAHREEIDRAAEFGQELSTRFSASSTLGVKELWRIFKVFNKPKKAKVKKLAKDKTRAHPQDGPQSDAEHEIGTVLDSEDPAESSQENDTKRAVLQAFAEIADLHERVKNIFIWRRPASSRIYGLILIFLFLLTLLVPAQYLAKITAFIGGFFFWHVTPIIASLPASDRARLPPAFADVPTDAEHAMDLISQRVAAGLPIRPVQPSRAKPRDKKQRDDGVAEKGPAQTQSQNKDKEVDWKKWGERAAVGMSWAEDGKRIFTAGKWPQNTNRATLEHSVETHTFPAQHTSAPGLITLTTATLYFTPLMASTAKLEIPLTNLRGVKKQTGLFTALTIVWIDEQGAEKEEKFRLSSNLMIGVARVYKVKQEIFMTDVSNCVASLKKVVQEMQSIAAAGEQLQMAQPAARPSAVTLAKDPGAAYLIDFDALVADWDEYLNIGDHTHKPEEDESEDEFDPKSKSKKSTRKNKAPQPAEEPRADLYTLQEHHDHLLSNSFDLSFNGNGMDPSSSQNGGGFALDDIFLAAPDGLDIGEGLGDDLAKELGEGWGVFPDNANDMQLDNPVNNDADVLMDLDLGIDSGFDAGPPEELPRSESMPPSTPRKRKADSDRDKENIPPSTLRRTNNIPTAAFSPATSFSRLLLSQDEELQPPLVDVTADNQNQKNTGAKKIKKTRLLLDARTELTDDELKAARAQYLKGQAILRRGLVQKRVEKDGGKFIEDLVWGVPRGVQAESLVEFWQENFKVQVEARTGAVSIHPADEPPKKRRKIRDLSNMDDIPQQNVDDIPQDFGNDMREEAFDNDFNMQDADPGIGLGDDYIGAPRDEQGSIHRRSSEEPGQGRHVSRPPSVLASNFDIVPQLPASGSQRSSLFPWDNAGGGSSSDPEIGPMGSDRVSVDRADIRMRGSSLSRRDSSLVPSQSGSVLDGLEFSPGFAKSSQALGEDYAFDVDNQPQSAVDSQRSDMNLITLERNSFNFLEYVRMQLQGLPNSVSDLSFDGVVPMATSTRHVAAAAFYHCLVLATKDLLRVKQPEPYGALSISIA